LDSTRIIINIDGACLTIPEEIAKEMQLSVGDIPEWETEVRKNRKVMVVKKLE